MDDWETKTTIGFRANNGGGGPREKVIKSKTELNKAARSGAIVATEKKFSTANAVSIIHLL